MLHAIIPCRHQHDSRHIDYRVPIFPPGITHGHPQTKVNEDKLADWLRSPITGNLQEVPGIGEKTEQLLAAGEGDERVTNTYQLVGKFLQLKGPSTEARGVGVVEHCDKFYFWLQEKGINAGRNNIILALAEKCEVFMPGIYDQELYTAEDEADAPAPAA